MFPNYVQNQTERERALTDFWQNKEDESNISALKNRTLPSLTLVKTEPWLYTLSALITTDIKTTFFSYQLRVSILSCFGERSPHDDVCTPRLFPADARALLSISILRRVVEEGGKQKTREGLRGSAAQYPWVVVWAVIMILQAV